MLALFRLVAAVFTGLMVGGELHEQGVPSSGSDNADVESHGVAVGNWWILRAGGSQAGTGAQVPEPRRESVVQLPKPRSHG